LIIAYLLIKINDLFFATLQVRIWSLDSSGLLDTRQSHLGRFWRLGSVVISVTNDLSSNLFRDFSIMNQFLVLV